MSSTFPIAINPLPWVFTPAGGFTVTEERIADALTVLGPLGYAAVQADVPAGMTVAAYQELLSRHGFRPAPGYLAVDCRSSPTPHTALAAITARASNHARTQAQLGLDVSFVASTRVQERERFPGIGAEYVGQDHAWSVSVLSAVVDAFAAEGVTAALHPHVATAVETEQETDAMLTAVPALAFGPDLGHLAWVTDDVLAVLTRWSERVVAVHVKDVERAAVRRARAAGLSYAAGIERESIWREPNRGALVLTDVFAVLPTHFAGWVVVEVDVPSVPTAAESSRIALTALRRAMHHPPAQARSEPD